MPLPSVVAFAALWPMSLAFFVQLFVGRHVDDGRSFSGVEVLWRTIAVGILASIGTAVLPLPATVGGAVSGSTTVAGLIYAVELVVVSVVAVPVLIGQWRRCRRDGDPAAVRYSNPLILRYAAAYLAVMAVLWVTALPAYFSAVDGMTPNGDPIGNLWYTVGCLVIASLAIAAAGTAAPRNPQQPDALVPTPHQPNDAAARQRPFGRTSS